jgi:hypothetical protein
MHLTVGLSRVVAGEAPECLAGAREVLTGGDVVSGKAVDRVLAACPDTVVRAAYGATELAAFIVNHPMRAPYQPGNVQPVVHRHLRAAGYRGSRRGHTEVSLG